MPTRTQNARASPSLSVHRAVASTVGVHSRQIFHTVSCAVKERASCSWFLSGRLRHALLEHHSYQGTHSKAHQLPTLICTTPGTHAAANTRPKQYELTKNQHAVSISVLLDMSPPYSYQRPFAPNQRKREQELVGVGGRLRRGSPTAAFSHRRVGSVASEGITLSKVPLL